jgi:hypothetical protein
MQAILSRSVSIDIPQQISGEFQHERLVEKWQVRD